MDRVLVALQFGVLALLLVWALFDGSAWSTNTTSAALLAAAGVIGLWAVTANRPGNFNIIPVPREGAKLITRGPYRWVRHPMYTSVLLFGLACATRIDHLPGWLAWLALFAILWFKARLEEKYLLDVHAAYETYMVGTKRFIPWIL